jgi:anti-sigma-K factor RskA
MNEDPHDLVAAYALDALDEDERERFEGHLAECEDCSKQLALLQESAAVLAYAAEGPAPPPRLRGRILDDVHSEPRAAVIRMPRRNWGLAAVAGVAAVAACLAIGLGIWANSLSSSLDRERSANAAYQEAARVLAAKASAKPLVGADGSLLVARDGRAALVVCGLTGAPASKTYEAWVITGKTPQPAGLFRGGSGCKPVLLTQRVPTSSTVAVTLEKAGGTTSPTLPILFRAEAT